ncbi:hypothetical protein ACA910_020897 [Epithemia clementina (nom. ined.)]
MGNEPPPNGTDQPAASPTVDHHYPPPGQVMAPLNFPHDPHGFTLQFEFQPTKLPATSHPKAPRPDTFNAVEALRRLADALFTSTGHVEIHDIHNGNKISSLTE